MCLRRMYLTAFCLALAGAAGALEFREEPYRVGVVDVGQPVLLQYPELTNEMNLNSELRDWIDAYGRPEYAEYQRVAISEPFLPYEIRLYYIEGRTYAAFGRVHVSPVMRDYGVRKYVGKLDSAMLQRLLTARPLEQSPAYLPDRDVELGVGAYGSARALQPVAAVRPVAVESVAVEGVAGEEVVEIITPESAMHGGGPVSGEPFVTGDAVPAADAAAETGEAAALD